MNTTIKFFETKEQYLAFRNAFASAQKDKRAHKSYSDSTASVWDSEAKAYKTIPTKIKQSGWMHSAHYLLFNLVVGKDYYSGFSPKTKALFVNSGGDPDRGLNGAISTLSDLINSARIIMGLNTMSSPPSWIKDKKQWVVEQTASHQSKINNFLEVFGGVFTLPELARVQLPSFPGCPANRDEVAGKKLTYREMFGADIVDQTPDEEVVATVAPIPVPEKKGLLARIFS